MLRNRPLSPGSEHTPPCAYWTITIWFLCCQSPWILGLQAWEAITIEWQSQLYSVWSLPRLWLQSLLVSYPAPCWVGLCVLWIQLLNTQTLIPQDVAILKAESLDKVIIQYYWFSCERRKCGHKQKGHQRKMNEDSDQDSQSRQRATASREKHGLDSSSGSQKEAAMLTPWSQTTNVHS